jgi:phosphoribosylanthranilate isomerase
MTTKLTKIKVCGMTLLEDVEACVNLGVDAIGVILYANSPRTISLEAARKIRAQVPDDVLLVGVFVNAEYEFIETAIRACGLDIVQLHGDETNKFGVSLSKPFVKAVRVKDEKQLNANLEKHPDACALLLDPYVKGQHGGTGKQLDLAVWPTGLEKPLVLAGGLSPINIKEAVRITNPDYVDLNSGVELSPGVKDIAKVQLCVEMLRAVS